MAWFTSLNNLNNLNLGDLVVTKLSEGVKSIEKNFDSALGFEVRSDAPAPVVVPEPEPEPELEPELEPEPAPTPAQAPAPAPASEAVVEPVLPEPRSAEDAAPAGGSAVPDGASQDPQEGEGEVPSEDGRRGGDGDDQVVQALQRDRSSEQMQSAGEPPLVQVGSLPATVLEEVEMEVTKAPSANGEVVHESTEGEKAEDFVEARPIVADRSPGGEQHDGKANGVINFPVVRSSDAEDKHGGGREMQMLEAALQGAARQAQAKADEISRLLIENEDLKATIAELKSKSSDAELEALRQEYQHRLGTAERKVYALTKERDMLRREQSRKSDSSPLLKEKDEIIKQVMAEGEELSKKQAAQEAHMKKLRAQIRELEEEKSRLNSRLQVEEAKVESIRKDKAATEKALQEAVEKGQAELAAQKEYYVNLLHEAREAEAQAEARANSDAKADLDRRVREASEREATLLQTLDELRHALSKADQLAAHREDMLQRDMEELENRCKGAEERYAELLANMPESTRPLLRQIEALQEATAVKAEAWSAAERSLNARLQEAEARAAAAQERERSSNDRLSQTLSRMAVMEAQLSCLRAEQAQLQRSVEKERQRALENRQEYLAAAESAANQDIRNKQLEEELNELKKKIKRSSAEERASREVLEQKLEQARQAVAEFEKRVPSDGWANDKNNVAHNSQTEYSSTRSLRRLPSGSSAGSVEESYYLQTTLDSDRQFGERFSFSDPTHFGKGFITPATLEQVEAHLRQKEGELASYAARLNSLESTRNSLAEELVKLTTQCEQYRLEASSLPALRAEFDSLRRRHTSALELMGERDEEVEELRADLADVKQMYREQIDLLVGQIERLSATR